MIPQQVISMSPRHAPVAYQASEFVQAVPVATAAVDTTGDGVANILYTGVDRNMDGIPDALQSGLPITPMQSKPLPTRNPLLQTFSEWAATVFKPLCDEHDLEIVCLLNENTQLRQELEAAARTMQQYLEREWQLV